MSDESTTRQYLAKLFKRFENHGIKNRSGMRLVSGRGDPTPEVMALIEVVQRKANPQEVHDQAAFALYNCIRVYDIQFYHHFLASSKDSSVFVLLRSNRFKIRSIVPSLVRGAFFFMTAKASTAVARCGLGRYAREITGSFPIVLLSLHLIQRRNRWELSCHAIHSNSLIVYSIGRMIHGKKRGLWYCSVGRKLLTPLIFNTVRTICLAGQLLILT